MAALILNSPEDTARLGQILAKALCANAWPPLFLTGPPGCGKTTLTAQICRFFPGAEEAEVSSPSFNICNLYPGKPPVLHCDLYRCQNDIPDEALDFIDEKAGQIIMEWAEYMRWRPAAYLDISFSVVNNARLLDLNAHGQNAEAAARQIWSHWAE